MEAREQKNKYTVVSRGGRFYWKSFSNHSKQHILTLVELTFLTNPIHLYLFNVLEPI